MELRKARLIGCDGSQQATEHGEQLPRARETIRPVRPFSTWSAWFTDLFSLPFPGRTTKSRARRAHTAV
jgi:hypothetical protein